MSKLLLFAPLLSFGMVVTAITQAAEETASAGFTAWLVPILIIAVLISLNGLYVASEFAILGARPSLVETMANNGDATAGKILDILQDPAKKDSYIATAQLGITIASLGLGMYAEPAIAHLIEPYLASWFGIESAETLHTISYILVLSLLTYLHVVVGEMIPKAIALSNAADTAIRVSRAMNVSQAVLIWLVRGLRAIGDTLLRALRLPPAPPRHHSPEEIEYIVSESVEGGMLNHEEEEIIRNIFDFSDRRVGQVMTPRPRVQAISTEMSYSEICSFVAESNHTRFPVYQDDRDHIIGVLHLRDLASQMLAGQTDVSIDGLLADDVITVPEDTLVEELLGKFRSERIHMAMVIDEQGGVAGLVTLEDLVEEIVGEVRDEFDVEDEPIIQLADGSYEVEGEYLLEALVEREILPTDIELPDVETIGGLIVTKLGRPPQIGDSYPLSSHVRLAVVAIDGLAVQRATIRFVGPSETPPPPEREGNSDH